MSAGWRAFPPDTLKADLKAHDTMPSMAEDPTFYADWAMSRQFEVILGRGECA